jgi:hypothetical protein
MPYPSNVYDRGLSTWKHNLVLARDSHLEATGEKATEKDSELQAEPTRQFDPQHKE